MESKVTMTGTRIIFQIIWGLIQFYFLFRWDSKSKQEYMEIFSILATNLFDKCPTLL